MEQKNLYDDYRMVVNPTFQTAQQTLYMLAAAGNPGAKVYVENMGIQNDLQAARDNADKKDTMDPEEGKNLMVGATLGVETRYETITRLLKKTEYKNVFDIACGYTPRALTCFSSGYDYVGFDIPVVAEKMNQVAEIVCDKKSHAVYVGGDATNAASMMAAADLLDGELFITSEGLLTYLSKTELNQMIAAICQVLKKHGGAWYSSDMEVRYDMIAAANMDNPQGLQMFNNARENLKKKTEIYFESADFQTMEEKVAFFEERGLLVERLPFYEDDMQLNMLHATTLEKAQKMKDLLKRFYVWKMTLKEDAAVTLNGVKETEHLTLDYKAEGGILNIKVSGRIDTLSAPELFGTYDMVSKKQTIAHVSMDAENMTYISSAGLRVLLMMVKKMGQGSLEVYNTTEEVKGIFSTTNFDSIIEVR